MKRLLAAVALSAVLATPALAALSVGVKAPEIVSTAYLGASPCRSSCRTR